MGVGGLGEESDVQEECERAGSRQVYGKWTFTQGLEGSWVLAVHPSSPPPARLNAGASGPTRIFLTRRAAWVATAGLVYKGSSMYCRVLRVRMACTRSTAVDCYVENAFLCVVDGYANVAGSPCRAADRQCKNIATTEHSYRSCTMPGSLGPCKVHPIKSSVTGSAMSLVALW